MRKNSDRLNKPVRDLLEWYETHARDLPWRRTRDPYGIWISEIMLQQTQVATVIPYWERWMKSLPTLDALADAPLETVFKLWEGLGYYRRARFIKETADWIQKNRQSRFPDDYKEILSLPGIGPYTAGAISSIAFDRPHPVLDGNVKRLLSRFHAIRSPLNGKETLKGLWEESGHWVQAASLLRDRFPRPCAHINQALMELGATLCVPTRPDCPHCPIRSVCRSRQLGIENEIPLQSVRSPIAGLQGITIVLKKGGRFLMRQKTVEGWHAGLWEFPSEYNLPGRAGFEELTQWLAARELPAFKAPTIIRHSITRYRIQSKVHFLICENSSQADSNHPEGEWKDRKSMENLPMPSAQAKIRQILREYMS